MIGAGMSPEAQYQLAMKMPEASLANILKGIPGDIDQSVAMMVLSQRQRMKTATQGQQAAKQAQEPSVKDRMLQSQQAQLPENQGIGTLPSPNMGQVAAMAQGGVVGFAEGARVTSTTGGASYSLDLPETIPDPSVSYYREIPNPMYQRLGKSVFPTKAAAENAYRVASGAGSAALAGMSDFDKAYPAIPRPAAAPAPTAAPAPAAPPAPATPPPAPRGRTAPPAPAPQGGIGVLGAEMFNAAGDANDRAMVAPDAPPAAGLTALTPPAAAPARVPASKVYSDQMTEALKALTSTPEEKDKQKDERLGVMALQAASALLQPGTTGAGARSAVFGKMAALTQQYGKEDREDKRAAIGAKISVLGAQMNSANQQEQNAITLENHAGDTAFRYADLAGKEAQRKEEAKLGWAKLSNEEKKLKLDEVYRAAHLKVMSEATASQERVGMGRNAIYANRGANDDKLVGQYVAAANTSLKALAAGVGPQASEAKKILADPALVRQYALTLMSRDGGSGIGTPKTSIQRDTLPGKISSLSDDED